MEGLTLSDVIELTHGHWIGKNDPSAIVPTGVSIDTRTLKPGEIFFALPGEKVDGHQFLDAAFARGACAAVVTRSGARESQQSELLVAVDAPDLALGDLARSYRRRFDIPVIGITGSSGKTTTKDMLAAVLSTRYRVLATKGNLNSRLGVPLTLFNLSAHCDVAVIEMGISERGGMRYLCEIAQPTIGMITNIGPAHIEFFGSVEGVAKAKGELLEYLDESSMTILNLDDLFLSKERAKVKGRLLGIGIEQICQFRGEGLKLDQKGFGHFSLQGHSFHLSIPGKHNVYNALMAATAGWALNVPLQDAAKALENFTLTELRSQVLEHNGIRLINDTYNANPASMGAALETLSQIEVDGRRIAVVGDMRELGAMTHDAHRALGREAGNRQIDALFALGDLAEVVVDGGREAGIDQAWAYADQDALTGALQAYLKPGDLMLIKGSRGIAMERIVTALGFEM
ncbi:MAG: UDP-N-acetylmuramoyl-tripeptide--D-alanyl-D-alanine ligase [Gemmatimonadota bacterium]|nr:UDP-N-acetylmuramoyl-tripeptide--D-alanyl-D-alanine ligase [Gemmatimonadota bacterium]